jgi:hypothetical protein
MKARKELGDEIQLPYNKNKAGTVTVDRWG